MADGEPPAEEQLVEVPALTDEDLEPRQACFDEIFAECGAEKAKAASLAERKGDAGKEAGLDVKPGLTYSEIDFPVIHFLLNKIKEEHGPLYQGRGVFLDLGSGAGKACVAAGLLHPFEKVVGIELLQSLSDMATAAQAKYTEAQLPVGVVKPPLEFVKGDFVAEFAEKIDPLAPQVKICVAAATHYSPEQLQAMTNLAKKMPSDSIFISFTQRLPEDIVIDPDRHPRQRRAKAVKQAYSVRGVDPDTVEVTVDPPENDPNGWTSLMSEQVQLGWGSAMVYVYKKIPTETPEGEAEGGEPPAPAEA